MTTALLLAVAAAEAVTIAVLVRSRAHAAQAAARQALVARVGRLLAESMDARAALPEVLRHLVPDIADWCLVHVVDDKGPRRLAMVHSDPALERKVAEALEAFPFEEAERTRAFRVIRSGEPDLLARVPPEWIAALPDPLRELARQLDIRSQLVVPLKARQAAVGSLSLTRTGSRRRPFSASDVEWAQDLARRIGLALDNTRLYAEARELFEETISANFVSTPEGRILACNRAFAELLGTGSIEEALDAPASSFYANLADRERFLDALRASGRLVGFEIGIRRRDGRLLTVSENAVGTFNDRGDLVKISGFIVDRSAERALEERLREAHRLEAVGQLAGGIAHDFNNLLTVIIGCAELLQAERAGAPPASGDPLEDLRKAAQRAAALTHQLLAFSRRQVLQPRLVDVNEALRGVHSMLRRLARENVVLVLDLDPAVPQVRVDPGQLEQVIVNLALNAGDAMPQGGVLTLGTANLTLTEGSRGEHPWAQPGRYVSVAVRDTGVGMDEATCARAFEPFFTTKPVGQGTGLGLSTVYGIVEQSGGLVWLTSEPGRGTTVTVCLPAVES